MAASRAVLPFYELAMRAALPVLARNHRLCHGWGQRVFREDMPAPADLWIQAASVGEAFLAWELVKALENPLPGRPLSVLLTTNTREGLSILSRVQEHFAQRADLRLQAAYFPMDAPSIMRRALARIQPRTAVLLESEIWPGFLAACKDASCEVLLVNGRMSTKSLAGYLSWPRFFKDLGPDRILAMSEADAMRFAAIHGPERVETMRNIKFDRLEIGTEAGPEDAAPGPLDALLADAREFVIFGSIRKQEEPQAADMVEGYLAARPGAVVGLFPRHLQRVDAWAGLLRSRGIPFRLRGDAGEHGKDGARPGEVILWDRVGELGAAYRRARCAFVGGSLLPLGGQNFLEPLAEGVPVVIGPHWANFAWVGREVVELGLVRERPDADAALRELLALAGNPPGRAGLRAAFAAYAAERRGGAGAACARIAESLTRV